MSSGRSRKLNVAIERYQTSGQGVARRSCHGRCPEARKGCSGSRRSAARRNRRAAGRNRTAACLVAARATYPHQTARTNARTESHGWTNSQGCRKSTKDTRIVAGGVRARSGIRCEYRGGTIKTCDAAGLKPRNCRPRPIAVAGGANREAARNARCSRQVTRGPAAPGGIGEQRGAKLERAAHSLGLSSAEALIERMPQELALVRVRDLLKKQTELTVRAMAQLAGSKRPRETACAGAIWTTEH